MDKAKKVSMNLPVYLLKEAVKACGAANKTEAVILGLKELIYKKAVSHFTALRGKASFGLTLKQLKGMRSR